jgi:hypothetical protein
MHLAHISLNRTGKSKVKKKFRSAEEAKQYRELAKNWEEIESKWKPSTSLSIDRQPLQYKLSTPVGRETARISSLNTKHTGAVSSKPSPKYTGTLIAGIATLHKSNAVPILNKQDAEDISKMRR